LIGARAPQPDKQERKVNEELVALKAELVSITKKMDLPDFRRKNPRWLVRNMVVRNAEHPQYGRAQEIAKELLRRGVATF